jgi:hypothetical protein
MFNFPSAKVWMSCKLINSFLIHIFVCHPV